MDTNSEDKFQTNNKRDFGITFRLEVLFSRQAIFDNLDFQKIKKTFLCCQVS